jgi:hypothetical protein
LTSVTALGTGVLTTVQDMSGTTIATVTDMAGQVTSQSATLANGVVLQANGMQEGVLTSVNQMATGTITSVTDMAGNSVTTVTDMSGQVVSQYTTMGSEAGSAVQQLASQTQSGFQQIASSSATASHAIDTFKSGLTNIHAPDLSAVIQEFKKVGTAADAAAKSVAKVLSDGSKVSGIQGGSGTTKAGKASGGPVTGGTSYLVGEAGPELFVPGQSGTIIPNSALTRGGGSPGGTTIVNNFYGMTQDEALAEVDRRQRRATLLQEPVI